MNLTIQRPDNIDITPDQLRDITGLVAVDLQTCLNAIKHLETIRDNVIRWNDERTLHIDDDGQYYFYDQEMHDRLDSQARDDSQKQVVYLAGKNYVEPITIDGWTKYACHLHARWLTEDLPHQEAKRERLSELMQKIEPGYDLNAIISKMDDDRVLLSKGED